MAADPEVALMRSTNAPVWLLYALQTRKEAGGVVELACGTVKEPAEVRRPLLLVRRGPGRAAPVAIAVPVQEAHQP